MAYQNIERTVYPTSIRDVINRNSRRILYRLTGKRRHHFPFIACLPKSGSTWLMRIVGATTGYPRRFPVQFGGGPHEQDFDKYHLHKLRYLDGVCHQHLRGIGHNVKLLNKYDIRVVILVRNIYDTLPSLRDHIIKYKAQTPSGYIPTSFYDLDEEAQYMFLARYHLPWYFHFLLSWQQAQHEVPAKWITYEDLLKDPCDTVKCALDFWGLSFTPQTIQEAIDSVGQRGTRHNQGISGRGNSLPSNTRDIVKGLADNSLLSRETLKFVGIDDCFDTSAAV